MMHKNIFFVALILYPVFSSEVENITTENSTVDETKDDAAIELEPDPDRLDIYDESDTIWIRKAVLDVAYYFRSHKFNDFDRRFYSETPDPLVSNLFGLFPNPPLKYFHWSVFSQCKNDFVTCLRYLHETVLDAYLQRSVDSVYLIRQKKLSLRSSEVRKIEKECIHLKNLDNTKAEPFSGLLDRFHWRVTASYYMCFYTIQKISYLEHFGEPCDNFANCLQRDQPFSNVDVRTDDSIPFQCAMYSFCPDPCCSHRKLKQYADQCSNPTEVGNPCHKLNNNTCLFNASLNTSFTSMIYNQWNVTCFCHNNNLKWSSRYGMCIDNNECQIDNPCDPETEFCVNYYGDYLCFCKFGNEWSNELNRCVPSQILESALRRYSGLDADSDGAIIFKGYRFLIITSAIVTIHSLIVLK